MHFRSLLRLFSEKHLGAAHPSLVAIARPDHSRFQMFPWNLDSCPWHSMNCKMITNTEPNLKGCSPHVPHTCPHCGQAQLIPSINGASAPAPIRPPRKLPAQRQRYPTLPAACREIAPKSASEWSHFHCEEGRALWLKIFNSPAAEQVN